MPTILYFSLLLLTTFDDIHGESLINDVGVQLKPRPIYENHWSSNENRTDVVDFLIFPIPEIIAKLACLEGASMQKQLNSGLSWPTELPKINETIQINRFGNNVTAIIKKPLNFRETLKRINQQLNKTLKTINTTTDEIISKMQEAQIFWKKTIKWFEASTHALSHYLIHYQELETFIKLISEQLNDLKNASNIVVLLFNPISAELEEMANLIKLFAEAVYDIQSVKQDYAKSALKNELTAKNNLKSELKKEITLLKKEIKQLESKKFKSLVKLEKKMYRYLNSVRKHNKNSKVLACLENTVKNLNGKDDFYVTCGSKPSLVERKKLKEVEIAKLTLKKILQVLIENKNYLRQKEELQRNILVTVKLLKKTKKRMDQDITFLDNTIKLIDELENQMEELNFNGWMKLVSLCEDIQIEFPKVKVNILSLKFMNLRSFEKVLQQTEQRLMETAKNMSLVGRILSIYLLAYKTELDSLVSQLEQMTNSDDNLAKLEENLINACSNTSREFKMDLAMLKL